MFALLPSQWANKKFLAAVAGMIVLAVATLVLQKPAPVAPVILGTIPIPFAMNAGNNLQGALTHFGQRNGIDVEEVTFNQGEPFETLVPDRIYLVHVPSGSSISDVPLDLALTLVDGGSHLVDYYGYRYSDAAATMERRDIAALRFKDRFPGQFFMSKTARQQDALHGNMLANFEAANTVSFRPTDATSGSVRVDPAGALYVLIVNSEHGAKLAVRDVKGCGNKHVEVPEQCDDGNNSNDDYCKNDCSMGLPMPFDSGNGTGTALVLMQQQLSGSAMAAAGTTAVPLLRFTAKASDSTRISSLVFKADTGSLTNLEHYQIWQDTNADGRVDAPLSVPVAPVGSTVRFDTLLDWSGAIVYGDARTFELRADVPASFSGVSVIRLAFATEAAGYVVADRTTSSFSLSGIRTNDVCTVAVCQIGVITKIATLWTLGTAPVVVLSQESGSGSTTGSGSTVTGTGSTGDGNISPAAAVCGNAQTEEGEQCDDGQVLNGQRCDPVVNGTCTFCSDSCQQETVQAQSVCGNHIQELTEECDDGNPDDNDECDTSCHLTTPTPDF